MHITYVQTNTQNAKQESERERKRDSDRIGYNVEARATSTLAEKWHSHTPPGNSGGPSSSSAAPLLLPRCATRPVSSNSSRGIITHLPGFQGRLPFDLQTGYVEVDDSNGVRLFYYFIRSERSPADDPLLLWVTGGPVCSVLTALAYEIGPLRFDLNSYTDGVPRLVHKEDSWTKVSNVIFLDSPVGTGFSYSGTEQGYQSSDTKAVNQILIFLKKWFDEHPEFLANPLYIAGDSYSGKIVPTVTSEIARGKEVGSEPNYNLKGYLVGNPVTDSKFDKPSKIPFAHGMGLISDEMYEAYMRTCSVEDNIYQSIDCTNSIDAIDECIEDICTNHVLEPLCDDDSIRRLKLKPKLNSGAREMLQNQEHIADPEIRLSEISSQCRTAGYMMSTTWANNGKVREALGIHKGTVPSWSRCDFDLSYAYDIPSTVKYHLDVTTRGYRSLVYSGDHDFVVPFIGTQAWIKSLNFSIVDEWRPWFVGGQVAGVVDILLQSTCQGSALLCLQGGFLVTPFDDLFCHPPSLLNGVGWWYVEPGCIVYNIAIKSWESSHSGEAKACVAPSPLVPFPLGGSSDGGRQRGRVDWKCTGHGRFGEYIARWLLQVATGGPRSLP